MCMGMGPSEFPKNIRILVWRCIVILTTITAGSGLCSQAGS
jgi:hypothetical protein